MLAALAVSLVIVRPPLASGLPHHHKYGSRAKADSFNTTLPGLGFRGVEKGLGFRGVEKDLGTDNRSTAEQSLIRVGLGLSKVGRRLASIQDAVQQIEDAILKSLGFPNTTSAPTRRLLQAPNETLDATADPFEDVVEELVFNATFEP